MNDAAFLQAIRDDPADDTLRLVYADYFEDRGDLERAAFIRIQCELSRGVPDRGRAVELLTQMRMLIVQHRPAWLGVLATLIPEAIFERGFIEQATLLARSFLDHAEALLTEHPITRLRLHGSHEEVRRLAACPWIETLTALELRENNLDDPDISALVSSPYLGRLQTLVLSRNSLTAQGLRTLLTSPNLPAVTDLIISNNPLGPSAASILANIQRLPPRLIHLDLSYTQLPNQSAGLLADAACLGRLSSLRLVGNDLQADGIEELALSPHLKWLALLAVWYNRLDSELRADLNRRYGPRVRC